MGLYEFRCQHLTINLLGVLPMGMYLVAIHQLDQASFFLCLVLSLGVVAPIKNFTNYVNQLKVDSICNF